MCIRDRWCGDPKYWGRTSPVLFPFVGAPKNKEYRYEGRTYPMGQHLSLIHISTRTPKGSQRSLKFV